MCRDHSMLLACQKQHRQNESGQVDIPGRVEVPCDVSLPVKNNTDRMNQLVR